MGHLKAIAGFVGFTALLLCTAASAQNSKLDTPVSRQPTVRSEINRGSGAAFACVLANVNVNTNAFVLCISASIDANQQQSTLSEPYEFGLYVLAISQVNNTNGSNSLIMETRKVWHDKIIEIMRTTTLSLTDYCEAISAADLKKCESSDDL